MGKKVENSCRYTMSRFVVCVFFLLLTMSPGHLVKAAEHVFLPGGETDSSESLDFRSPAQLILGRDTSATISIRKSGTEIPELIVNIGSISPLEETGDGRLEATYTPPDETFPQVAIIAALRMDLTLIDWMALPLYGQAEIDTQTESKARVEIQIDDEVFGPVVADKKGRTRIMVVVPPGVKRGVTRATDRVGNVKETPLDLGVPPFNRVLAFCPTMGDRFYILAVDELGSPDTAAPLSLRANAGELGPPFIEAPGIYRSDYSVYSGAVSGSKVRLEAFLTDNEGSGASCSLDIKGGKLARLEVDTSHDEFTPGDGLVLVRVRFFDENGHTAQPSVLSLSADLGLLGPLRVTPNGEYVAEWMLPKHFQGKTKALVVVASESDSTISANRVIELLSGPVSKLDIRLDEDSLIADGKSVTKIVVFPSDVHGNPVPDVKLSSRSQGLISPFSKRSEDGIYSAHYTAPQKNRNTQDEIVVEVVGTELSASRKVFLLAKKTLFLVGPRVGYITNFYKISSYLMELDVCYALPFLNRGFQVGLSFGVYWGEYRNELSNRNEEVGFYYWVVPIFLNAYYRVPIERFSVYLGVGGGFAPSEILVESESAGKTSTTDIHGGLSGLFGGDFMIGPGRIVLELAYRYIFNWEAETDGNIGGLMVTVGYRFKVAF